MLYGALLTISLAVCCSVRVGANDAPVSAVLDHLSKWQYEKYDDRNQIHHIHAHPDSYTSVFHALNSILSSLNAHSVTVCLVRYSARVCVSVCSALALAHCAVTILWATPV